MNTFSSNELERASALVRAFSPSRLALARRIAGKARKQLADEVAKTAAAVTQFELGQNRPNPHTLLACSRALNMPIEFFATGRPRLSLDTGAVHFRSLRATRVYQREQALGFVELIWEVVGLLEEAIDLPVPDLPPMMLAGSGQISPTAAAEALRRHWNLEPGPVPHLVRQCEAHGIVVSVLPRSLQSETIAAPEHPAGVGNVDAFSTRIGNRPFVGLVGAKGGLLRRRFNVAHELGHLLLHPEALPGDQQHEREAHLFAAELLMPAEFIYDELPPLPDVKPLVYLQRRWGSSVSALAYRGRTLGKYTEAQHRRFMITISRLGWRTKEPENEGLLTGEEPALLRRALDLAESVGVDVKSLAERLALPIPLLRALIGIVDARPRLTLIPGQPDTN